MKPHPDRTAAPGDRILVVDDEPDIIALVAYHLARSGYRVSTASTGTEALQAAREEQPALIVLDLMLPKLSGFQVLERLRADATFADVPVLMLTARRSFAPIPSRCVRHSGTWSRTPFVTRRVAERSRSLPAARTTVGASRLA